MIVRSPQAMSTPQPQTRIPPPPLESTTEAAPPAEDDDSARRAGLAARMAKLGGIKFGAPPIVPKKTTSGLSEPRSPITELPQQFMDAPGTPIDQEPPMHSPYRETPPSSVSATGDETPEQEAARRRATLARLRAGGALGFGMFNHGPASPGGAVEETRQLERPAEPKMDEPAIAPLPRPVYDEPEEEDTPPPPPAGRAPVLTQRQSLPPAPLEINTAPPPPARPLPPQSPGITSPTTPGGRPPIPNSEKRFSQLVTPTSSRIIAPPIAPPLDPSQLPPAQSFDSQLVNEPAVMYMDRSLPPSSPPPTPPAHLARQPSIPTPSLPDPPRRSGSIASRHSMEQFSPATRQITRQDSMTASPSRSSLQQQGRPGFDQLQAASRDSGNRLVRAAKGIQEGGRKAYLGVSLLMALDGSAQC